MKQLSIIIALFILIFSSCNKKTDKPIVEKPAKTDIPYVVMLSLDGFRWNYADRTNTPSLDKIAQKGIQAEMTASFPTKTFPNHYSIATGLYPDHHGIVNNTFWDPQRSVLYKISDRSKVQDGYFYGGEPIWVTAEKQDVRSASFFWVGSEAKIGGYYPSIWKTYEHNFPFYQRADSVIAWLQLPKTKRPHLITWYLSEPDGSGHHYGPESQQITDTIQGLDRIVGYFLDKLEKLDIANEVNVIIVSDHGMQEISNQRVIRLQDYVKSNWMAGANGGNPVYNIWAKNGFKDSIANALANVPHLSLYTKSTIPARLHYMTHERCGDFVAVADSSWSLFNSYIPNFTIGGTHGYDNANRNMNAIFYAYGPNIKAQTANNTKLNNVDIYNMICEILDLNAASNDGDAGRVSEFVK
jgi:alkaline phosphatase D